MRKLAFAAVAALALAASPAADARQSNDYVQSESGPTDYARQERQEEQLNDVNELIDWIDGMEAAFDSGSLLLIQPGNADGGMRYIYVPVDRDDVIRMIRIKVALGEITAQQGAAFLIDMARETARLRREFRAFRDRLVIQRRALRGENVQPWQMGQRPAGAPLPQATPQRSACPAATRWQIEVQGSQHSYHFVLVIRQDGTAAVVLPSGDVMTWVQTEARISGNTLTLNTRDSNGSGSLRATLTADCLRGQGQSQAYNGNNGPATLTRLN